MGKIFGISDLPVAKAFPSLEFGKTYIEKPAEIHIPAFNKADRFVKNNLPRKRFLKQFFSRVKH